jgi:hypothetical protein
MAAAAGGRHLQHQVGGRSFFQCGDCVPVAAETLTYSLCMAAPRASDRTMWMLIEALSRNIMGN